MVENACVSVLLRLKFGTKKLKKDVKMEREPVSVSGGAHVYDMTSKRRGIALIICNSEFIKMPSRKGATNDASRMYQTLSSLGFEPHFLKNLTYDEMVQNLKKGKIILITNLQLVTLAYVCGCLQCEHTFKHRSFLSSHGIKLKKCCFSA